MASNSEEIIYNFDNNESQKLFEEFTLLLLEITKSVEEQNKYIMRLEETIRGLEYKKNPILSKIKRGIKKCIVKFAKIFYKIALKIYSISWIKKLVKKLDKNEKLKNKLKKIKNRLG